MPGFNGTGPMGRGPRTGWGRGYCAPPRAAGTSTAPEDEEVAQSANPEQQPPYGQGYPGGNYPVYGRGRGGFPRGCGRGFGCGGGRGRRGSW
jgi:hypothetical protein